MLKSIRKSIRSYQLTSNGWKQIDKSLYEKGGKKVMLDSDGEIHYIHY